MTMFYCKSKATRQRVSAAFRAASWHLLGSLLVSGLIAFIVFYAWYPYPYSFLSGGLELFLIIVGVDAVCGPLLTLMLYSPSKSRRELTVDLGLVVLIQLAALSYGVHTVYDARPLFLVHEVDRFRVIAMPDYGDIDVRADIDRLDSGLRPSLMGGPKLVGVRTLDDLDGLGTIIFESSLGGRDLAQRPEFYVPYDEKYRGQVLAKAKHLRRFIERFPDKLEQVEGLLEKSRVKMDDAWFLPVIHRREGVAVMDSSANILGFVPGDGFGVD